jgi:hypothetical protein
LATAIGPNFDNDSADDPAVVSFDVVWSGPITRRVSVSDGTLGNDYAGNYVENQLTVTWSGTNLATGFSFTSNPGTFATSFFDGGFAELGKERNGIFFDTSSADTANRVQAGADAMLAWAANPASAGTALVTPPIAAGPGALTDANSQEVQAAPDPVQPPAGPTDAVIDQLFADLSGGRWEIL